jgi:DNA-binding response OmpR family regulator
MPESGLDGYRDALVLLEGTEASRSAALKLVKASSAPTRQRTILCGCSLQADTIREFIDAGVPDFIGIPAPLAELSLRLSLRLLAVRRQPESPPCDLSASNTPASLIDSLLGSQILALRLSDRESLLFALLAERAGEPVSREDILDRVWNRSEIGCATSNVVDVYVRYLRVKLARHAPHLVIVTVRHFGYALRVRNDVTLDP